ncbi:hypothetical protein P886_1979 [Alteromonadaceae bacterium 2753L.S.0a.02]|nr:hypothetical protein P886_1979 [Alteromonadaceae bacterium 2753L.S.0a.02]
MKDIVLIVLLALSSLCAAVKFDCMDMIGDWEGRLFDSKTGEQKRILSHYYENGDVEIVFISENGVDTEKSVERGRWDCDGSSFSINTIYVNKSKVDYFETYELLELTSVYRKYRPQFVDCGEIEGDCESIDYFESTRTNPEFKHQVRQK